MGGRYGRLRGEGKSKCRVSLPTEKCLSEWRSPDRKDRRRAHRQKKEAKKHRKRHTKFVRSNSRFLRGTVKNNVPL